MGTIPFYTLQIFWRYLGWCRKSFKKINDLVNSCQDVAGSDPFKASICPREIAIIRFVDVTMLCLPEKRRTWCESLRCGVPEPAAKCRIVLKRDAAISGERRIGKAGDVGGGRVVSGAEPGLARLLGEAEMFVEDTKQPVGACL